MTAKFRETLLTVLTLLVLGLAAANSLVFYTRIDMTGAFTISPVSKNLFREIPEQVTITYYVSERLLALSPVPRQIEDLVYEYAAHGRGKIRVSVIHPEKSPGGFRAENIGIVPQQIQVVERNEQTVATVYTGIVLSYLDRREVLPVVFDPSNLEYDLTRRIKKMVRGLNPTVGFLLGKDGTSLSADYTELAGRLAASYTVRELAKGESIPDDISVLFVIGGKDLDDYDLYSVDRYIMRGGKVLFAVDGVEVDLARNLEASPHGDLPIFELLAGYGVEVGRDLVLDNQSRRIPVQRDTGRMVVQSLEKYAHWVSVQGSGFSRSSPVTAGLSGLDLYWPSSLAVKERPGLTSEILARSGPDSWLMRDRLSTNPYEAASFRAMAADTTGRYPLAVALSGIFRSRFAGQSPPTRAGAPPPGTRPPDESRETRMIVTGDSEAASDLMRYSESLYNTVFFENAADWLSGDDSLMEIRARGTRDLRLNRIEDRRTRDTVILFSQVINLFVVPFIVAGLGVARYLKRRERREV